MAAAEQYLLAAETAEPPERIDLFCLGAHRLLTSGHVDPGIVRLKRVLKECGIHYPQKSITTWASLIWHRIRLKWRGYEFRVSQDITEVDLLQLQAYWAAVAGLSVVDPLRAADFTTRGLLHSLHCGERTHVIRNLTAFSGHVAASGYRKRKRVDRLLATIDDLAAQDGQPYALAGAEIARGVASHLQSQYRTSVKFCDRAVALLLDDDSKVADSRCYNATWELNVARSISLWSLMYMGQIDKLALRQPELLRAAEETNNLFAALNFSTQIMTHIMLAADRPDEARRRLQADGERLPAFGFFVQHQNHLLALAFLEQYCGCGHQAWQHLENARQRYTT